MKLTPTEDEGSRDNKIRPWLLWCVTAGTVVMLIALLWPKPKRVSTTNAVTSPTTKASGSSDTMESGRSIARRIAKSHARQPGKSAEEIVAEKLQQFSHSRRGVAERIARRRKEALPPEIAAFFDAVDKGDWSQIDSRWKELLAYQKNHERPELLPYLAMVRDTYGTVEQTHEWPAQQLLDYGNAILGSLRPGMVYVGGTDCGRFVPELLSETGDDPHVVITQNALADPTYLDLLSDLYGGQLNGLSTEDSQRAFQDYMADAQKRLQHDLNFPNEPKQVLPGENITMKDGHLEISGDVAVMAINEKLLQALMQKNPDLSFALEESFALRGTYGNAAPLGPLMELNAPSDQTPFTADLAAQSVDYWRSTAQALLADPEATGSDYALKAYSHDIDATANLLAAHNFTSQAEQAYQLALQVSPSNPEAVTGLAQVLVQTGHPGQAHAMLDIFATEHPDQAKAFEQAKAAIVWTAK